METGDTIAFLKEREEKLGAPLRYRTYSPWFGKVGGERRDYGVFLCTDGRTVLYEDFERNPMIMGIPLPVKNKEKYVKMEHSFPVSSIVSIERVLLNIVVRDKNVEKTVQAVMKAARTGDIGDGRIFVIPVEDSVRIRTGERGDIALYNAEQEK